MTLVSKNIYIDKLDDLVDEYHNTYHTTIKMKPVVLKIMHILILRKKLMIEVLNLKLVLKPEFQNTKIFSLKDTRQTGLKKFLWLGKLKIRFHGHYVINDLNGEEIRTFYENELQKTNQQEFRIEKVIKRKGDKLYVKWEGYDNSFNSWIDKKDLV